MWSLHKKPRVDATAVAAYFSRALLLYKKFTAEEVQWYWPRSFKPFHPLWITALAPVWFKKESDIDQAKIWDEIEPYIKSHSGDILITKDPQVITDPPSQGSPKSSRIPKSPRALKGPNTPGFPQSTREPGQWKIVFGWLLHLQFKKIRGLTTHSSCCYRRTPSIKVTLSTSRVVTYRTETQRVAVSSERRVLQEEG